MDYFELTAPCGIDCFNCELFGENITPEMQKRIAAYRNQPPETVRCLGCRESGCLIIPGECATKSCIASKKIDFCYQCDEFPCNRLHPCFDKSEKFPQNFKLFNLCRIRAVGLERWAEEEAGEIRRRFFAGKLEIGNGPQIVEERNE